MLLHAIDVIVQPGWSIHTRALFNAVTQSLTTNGLSLDTDSALRFPDFRISKLRRAIWVPGGLTSIEHLWCVISAIMVVAGGSALPLGGGALDALASALAQNPTEVISVYDYSTRRKLRALESSLSLN